MIVVEDIMTDLNALDDDHWCKDVTNILNTLSFPVEYSYSCNWKEFIYEKTNRLRFIKSDERNTLSLCDKIVGYNVKQPFSKIKVYAIKILDKEGLRNDIAYEITKVFHKLFGSFVMLVFVSCDEIAFTGIAQSENKHHLEVYISDWFGEKKDRSRNEGLLEIDFSLFSYTSINEIYESYLWAISMPYMKTRESTMYLMFGCDNIIIDDLIIPDPSGFGETLVYSVDRDETFRINSLYYVDLYGKDYFIDSFGTEKEDIDVFNDEEDIEFEWTMLEMELENEALKYDNEYSEDIHDYEDYEDDEDDYEFEGLNPEEMLDLIKLL